MSPLAAYLLAAMVAWYPPEQQPEGAELAEARYERIAADVAEVVSDPSETPLFDGDADRRRTGLLTISVAGYESKYSERIDSGHCHRDECDGRLAWSMWQIHPDLGLVIDTPTWRYGAEGFKGPDLAADRRVAARLFLHIIRGTHDHRYDSWQRRERGEQWAATHSLSLSIVSVGAIPGVPDQTSTTRATDSSRSQWWSVVESPNPLLVGLGGPVTIGIALLAVRLPSVVYVARHADAPILSL